MPYKIEKKQNGSFSVVNKDTGRVLSKGTTKAKAEKQIKAVYMHGGATDTMKPEHRLRYHVNLLKGRGIKNPLHRKIVDFAKELLKQEEIHGAGFWDDAWTGIKNVLAFPSQVLQEVPFVKDVVGMIFPESVPILNLVPQFTKYIYGDDTNLWLTDFLADAPIVGDIREDKGYKSSKELGRDRRDEGSVANLTYGDQHTSDLADTIQYIEKTTPQQSDTPYEAYEVPTYSNVNRNAQGDVIPLDEPLRFPIVYNYDPGREPKNLHDYLISQGVAGKDFSIREFGNTVLNQRPFAFLDYPINGGSIRKIDYRKTCY